MMIQPLTINLCRACGGFVLLLLLLTTTVAIGQQQTSASNSGGVKGRVRVDGNSSTPAGVVVIARQGEREITRVETNRKGEFLVQGLEPGVYGFTFRKPGLSIGRLDNVEVRAGKTRALRDRLFLTIDDGSIAFIRGSVFDPNGRVVPGARIELALVRPDGSDKKLDGRISSESGLFVFRLPPDRARYRVTVKASGMQPVMREVEIDGAARTNVALTLQPAAN